MKKIISITLTITPATKSSTLLLVATPLKGVTAAKMVMYLIAAVITCLMLTLNSCTSEVTSQIPTETKTPSQTQAQTTSETAPPSEIAAKTPDSDIPESFEGKIAIITLPQGEGEAWNTAMPVIKKYGEDKVIHVSWPGNFMEEQEEMINIVEELGKNPEIKAIIVNPAVIGTTRAFNKLRETRDDIFEVFCEPEISAKWGSRAKDITQTANLSLVRDFSGMISEMVKQAQNLGAKTFVQCCFPRHMNLTIYQSIWDTLIPQECEKLGIKYEIAWHPDPASDIGLAGAQQFAMEDISRLVEEYGKDTAFFSRDCTIQSAIIKAVLDAGAIYPSPCCPSPYHGFVEVVDIRYGELYYPIKRNKDIIAQTKAVLAVKGMLGRVSTWPVSDNYMYTAVGAEYAIKWINGEVPKEGIDVDVLKQLMEDYAGVSVYLTPYKDEYPYTDEGTGDTYDNFLMMTMDYITFE